MAVAGWGSPIHAFRRRRAAFVVSALVALAGSSWNVSRVVAAEYFIDFDASPGVGCSDAGPGSDPRSGGMPWCTLPGTRVTGYSAGFLPGPRTRIRAGDVLSVKAGSIHTSADGAGAVLIDPTYYDDGTAAARIVVRKHPTWGDGSHAVFDGTAMAARTTGLVAIFQVDYVTLDGLEVLDAPDIGIEVNLDAHHVVIEHAYVHDGTTRLALVLLTGCTTSPCMQVVRNSVVAFSADGGGIFVYDNPGGHVLVESNVVHHICARGSNLDAIQCGATDGSTSYCAIRNNVVHAHAGASGYPGCPIAGSDPIGTGGDGCHHHALVDGNEVYDATGRLLVHAAYTYACDDWGFESHNIVRRNRMTNIEAITYFFPNDTIFYNNTFYNPARENLVQIWTPEAQAPPGTSFGTPAHVARAHALGRDVDYGRLTFKNNIMWGQTKYHVLLNGVAGFRNDVRWSSLRLYFNLYRGFFPALWYPNETDQTLTYYGTAAAYVSSRATDAPDVGSLFSSASPADVFVDAPSRDYRLAEGSPGIDAGTAITHAVGASAGGAGSSVRLRVERAAFVDGWGGLFAPDHLTVGDCPDVAIVAIDDVDAAIVLAAPCRWNDGDPVNLASQGTAPDLGAFETEPAPPPTPLSTPTLVPTAVPTNAATAAPNRCGDGALGGAEQCDDGNVLDGDCCSAACTFAAPGSVCGDDADACTDDRCDASGTCRHPAVTCGSCEACDPTVGCAAAPRQGCRQSTKPRSNVLQLGTQRSPTLTWVWANGAATTLADFGDPRVGPAYTLCLYDESGPRPTVAFRATTRAGLCDSKPCWKQPNASSFSYKDREQTPDGLAGVLLKSGAAGKAKLRVTGHGLHLHLPALPLALPTRVQLQREDGPCWESRHSAADVSRNTGRAFKAKASAP